ncbi:MAG: AAA family ATPase [Desulfovibrio sp.]|nr:AAA family ATPase [Desulfovibrio sp.]
MLEYLHIRNLALIEDVAIEFCPGMNVLTGETGAGKSFILKALSFLLGDRLKPDMVRPSAERAIVEGLFQTEDGELLLRRELSAETGRSRVFVNDTLHTQETLKELRDSLITYTSQHAQQKLLQPAFQSRLVERHLPDLSLLEKRDSLLAELKSLDERENALLTRQRDLLDKRDLLEMQQEEIARVSPKEGEEEELEARRQKARNNKDLLSLFDTTQKLLLSRDPVGLFDNLRSLERSLSSLSAIDEGFLPFLNASLDFRASLDALSSKLASPPVDGENADLDAIEERLYVLAQLKRKLHRSFAEICELQKDLEESLSFLDSCALDLSQLGREKKDVADSLRAVLSSLIPARRKTAETFCQNLQEELKGLAFSEQVRVIPDFLPVELREDVADERIRFLWAPNPGQPSKPLDHIASGGELSRFLLALTSLETRNNTTTFIFDEVDAGVGGQTLKKLGDKLQNLSARNQTIVITHWPQLAASAERHFQVCKREKDGVTKTLCRRLGEEERRAELSRMAGGGTLGEAFLKSLPSR